jgi:hypothetical protein
MEIDLGILGSERMGDDLVEIEQGDRVGLGSLSAGARGSFIGKWVVYERQRPGGIALILVGESLGFIGRMNKQVIAKGVENGTGKVCRSRSLQAKGHK